MDCGEWVGRLLDDIEGVVVLLFTHSPVEDRAIVNPLPHTYSFFIYSEDENTNSYFGMTSSEQRPCLAPSPAEELLSCCAAISS